MTQTRAQRDLQLALTLVREVESRDAKVRKIYGGLCHQFPVMIRTVGLVQTLAFHETKAGTTEPRGQAHSLLLAHVRQVLGVLTPAALLSAEIAAVDTRTYMHDTRRVLTTWIYFKRFAVSILKVEDAIEAKDAT